MTDLQPGPDETLDPIVGEWQILQLRRGHRFSVDDLVTAWRAAANAPHARRLLDLGAGIGSVGLSTLWKIGAPDATLVGVEVQRVSHELAVRTVQINGLQGRVTMVPGDLRDPGVLPASLVPPGGFDLITGSPPYIPEGKGVLSPIPQRAGARIELKGSVYDYCAAARRWLAPGGRFAFVMAAQDPRTEDAPRVHGFTVVERLDVTFRAGRVPHICVLVCARTEDLPDPAPARAERTLTVRDESGAYTPGCDVFRREMGADGPLARARRSGSDETPAVQGETPA
jgi:tRNA1(Val) A37 N6-methylase TrmN6